MLAFSVVDVAVVVSIPHVAALADSVRSRASGRIVVRKKSGHFYHLRQQAAQAYA